MSSHTVALLPFCSFTNFNQKASKPISISSHSQHTSSRRSVDCNFFMSLSIFSEGCTNSLFLPSLSDLEDFGRTFPLLLCPVEFCPLAWVRPKAELGRGICSDLVRPRFGCFLESSSWNETYLKLFSLNCYQQPSILVGKKSEFWTLYWAYNKNVISVTQQLSNYIW